MTSDAHQQIFDAHFCGALEALDAAIKLVGATATRLEFHDAERLWAVIEEIQELRMKYTQSYAKIKSL